MTANERLKKWRAENPERNREINRRAKARRRADGKEQAYVKANPDRARDWYMRYRYGLSEREFRIAELLQGGRCLICERQAKLCVDHDHETGKIRGLLCRSCNGSLGVYEKNRDAIRRYLHEEGT